MLNVAGKGNLVNDNKVTTLKNGVKVLNNTIAFNSKYTNSKGDVIEKPTVFKNITLWRNEKNAEMFDAFAKLEKGTYVSIEGVTDIEVVNTNEKLYQNEFIQVFEAKKVEFTKKELVSA